MQQTKRRLVTTGQPDTPCSAAPPESERRWGWAGSLSARAARGCGRACRPYLAWGLAADLVEAALCVPGSSLTRLIGCADHSSGLCRLRLCRDNPNYRGMPPDQFSVRRRLGICECRTETADMVGSQNVLQVECFAPRVVEAEQLAADSPVLRWSGLPRLRSVRAAAGRGSCERLLERWRPRRVLPFALLYACLFLARVERGLDRGDLSSPHRLRINRRGAVAHDDERPPTPPVRWVLRERIRPGSLPADQRRRRHVSL